MIRTEGGDGLREARKAFVVNLYDRYGRDAMEDRADDILNGREDDDPFIHGYLAALKATPPQGDAT